MLLGPAIGASIALTAGPSAAMAVAALLCACAAAVRVGLPPIAAHAGSSDRRLTAGWSEAAADPLMRALLLLTVAELSVFGGLNIVVLKLADLHFHAPAAGGFLLVAFAVGGLAGATSSSLVSARPRAAVIWAPLVLACGLALAAVAPITAVIPVALVVCGWGSALAEIADTSLTQQLFQGPALTRVTGVTLAVAWSSSALGAVVTPALVSTVGVGDTALALAATLTLLTAIAKRATTKVRHDRWAITAAAPAESC
jgi:predicted MFS family arabinose efflux permease